MYSSNRGQKLNPFTYLFHHYKERKFLSGAKQGHLKKEAYTILNPSKAMILKNRYQDLPYHSEDTFSYLYYLMRRCSSARDFLSDQLVFLAHILQKCNLVEAGKYDVQAHSIERQLSFLNLMMRQISSDLLIYNSALKEAADSSEGPVLTALKVDGEQILSELTDFYDTIAFAKKSLYDLLRRSGVLARPPLRN